MTKQEADFIGSMNMCDEISNEAYKTIMCHCDVEESQPCEDCISRAAVLDKKELVELEDGQSFYSINPKDVEKLPSVTPQPKVGEWKYVTHYARRYRVCSECNAEKEDDRATGWDFCPNCGSYNGGGDDG